MQNLVQVRDLEIAASDGSNGFRTVVKKVDFDIAKGEVLALIGESGSGKTTIAMSLLGYCRPGTRISGGSIIVDGHDMRRQSAAALASLHGRKVAYIPQSAASAFNPSRTIMAQVIESALIHGVMSKVEAEAKAIELFRELSLPEPELIGARYPHQVSGGQLQRLLAAMALLLSPKLVIFDEPTTALDVTTQIEVLRAFKRIVADHGVTALYVSHDLAVVAQIADRIIVLRNGEIQEVGETHHLVETPKHPYTRSLMAAANPVERRTETHAHAGDRPVLKVTGLTAGYGARTRSGLPEYPVLQNINFDIQKGATLGIIGESGCGKSTLARVIAGLLPASQGTVELDGEVLSPEVRRRSRDQLRRVQIVYQIADTALNPSQTIADIIGRPLSFYHGISGKERRRRVDELLDMVKLPKDLLGRRQGGLSGGQKQRVNLARALAAGPELILCDEITSALDSVVGAAVLDLLVELQKELGLSYLFISHDLGTVRSICDDVMILYAGKVMEKGGRTALASAPWHPYSDLLLSSVPQLRTGWLDDINAQRLGGISAAAGKPPRGELCSFHPRCPLAIQGVCDTAEPPERHLSKGASIHCQLSEEQLKDRATTRAPIVAAL